MDNVQDYARTIPRSAGSTANVPRPFTTQLGDGCVSDGRAVLTPGEVPQDVTRMTEAAQVAVSLACSSGLASGALAMKASGTRFRAAFGAGCERAKGSVWAEGQQDLSPATR